MATYVAVDAVVASLQSLGYDSSPSAVLLDAVNQSYQRIVRVRRWDWLAEQYNSAGTIGAGGSNLTLALPEAVTIDAVRLTPTAASGERLALTYMDPQVLKDELHANTGDYAVPEYWSYYDNTVWVFPAADQAYTVSLDVAGGTTYTYAAGQTTNLPPQFYDVLLWGAVVALAFRQRDYGGLAYAESQFNSRLGDMVRQHGVKGRQGGLEVGRHSVWDQVER